MMLCTNAFLVVVCPKQRSMRIQSSKHDTILSPNSLQLRSKKNDDDKEEEERGDGVVKKTVLFGLTNFWSLADSVIWSSLTVSILLYFLGYTFDIDRENGFHVRVATIEQARTEKQLKSQYLK